MAEKCISLHWEGKRAAEIPIFPSALRCLEQIGHPGLEGWRNRLILGDNLAVMAALKRDYAGQFALIYLDPPFFTGSDFHVTTRAQEGATSTSTRAYTDKWDGELATYLQWMLDRLSMARTLLREDGKIGRAHV